jgi:hypothetical protein
MDHRLQIEVGRDAQAGGTWLGVNGFGLAARIFNGHSTLGQSPLPCATIHARDRESHATILALTEDNADVRTLYIPTD